MVLEMDIAVATRTAGMLCRIEGDVSSENHLWKAQGLRRVCSVEGGHHFWLLVFDSGHVLGFGIPGGALLCRAFYIPGVSSWALALRIDKPRFDGQTYEPIAAAAHYGGGCNKWAPPPQPADGKARAHGPGS